MGNLQRRAFLQTGLMASAAAAWGRDTRAAGASRPNLVYIFTDQQSATMLSCTGNPHLHTPAMDYLAAHGTRFERAYCANPVCVPSRIAMMTGRFPGEFEARYNETGMALRNLPEAVQASSIGPVLRAAGYAIAYGGKVHLPPDLTPARQGFEMLTGNEREGLADACAAYLRRPHDKPFCLVASFINPHDICYMALRDGSGRSHRALAVHRGDEGPGTAAAGGGAAPAKKQPGAVAVLDETLRRPAGLNENAFLESCPPLPPNVEPQDDEPGAIRWLLAERAFRQWARENYSDREWRLHRWAYARLTERVDREVGVVLAALRDSGLEENTVVILSSDHGDMDSAHRMEHKTALYEEAARIPLVIMHRGHTPAGRVDDRHLVSNGLDLLPTLCDYAGIAPPGGLRGRSLRPLAEGRPPADWRRTLGVESQIGRMVVRDDGLKYIRYDAGGAVEEQLLDLRRDPHETRQFARDPDRTETLAELREAYRAWFPE